MQLLFFFRFKTLTSSGSKRQRRDSHIPTLDLCCSSGSKIGRVLNQSASTRFGECLRNLPTESDFTFTPAHWDVLWGLVIYGSPWPVDLGGMVPTLQCLVGFTIKPYLDAPCGGFWIKAVGIELPMVKFQLVYLKIVQPQSSHLTPQDLSPHLISGDKRTNTCWMYVLWNVLKALHAFKPNLYNIPMRRVILS